MERLIKAAAEALSDEDTVVRMLGLAEPEPNPVWKDHIAHLIEEKPQIRALVDQLPIRGYCIE